MIPRTTLLLFRDDISKQNQKVAMRKIQQPLGARGHGRLLFLQEKNKICEKQT
jgi:hypothetical protein